MISKKDSFKYGFLKAKIDEKYGEEYSNVFKLVWNDRGLSKEKAELAEELVEDSFLEKSEGSYRVNLDKVKNL